MADVRPAERLDAEFRRIRSHLRRVSLFAGLAWCTAAGIGICLLIGLIDWHWHVDSARVRQWLVVGGGLLWSLLLLRRVVWPAVRPPSATELAQRIERLRPHWRGALVSSVEFLITKCRPELGAPALQSSVIARSQALLEESDVRPLIPVQERRLALAAVVVFSICAAAIAIADPSSARIAMQRMMSPTSAPAWPRQHTLVLLDGSFRRLDPEHPPRPGAIGERMRVYVDDAQAKLPDRVVLHIVTPLGERRQQPLERTSIAGKDGARREIGVALLPVGAPELRVRATGGDDQRMPWHTFEFLSRPTVERFRVRMTPPEYTGRPVEDVVATSGDLTALVGTRVRIDAELDRPVRKAMLRQTGLQPTTDRLSEDNRVFTVEFPIVAPTEASYSLDLLSNDGLWSAHSVEYRVDGIIDHEPTVALTSPNVDLTVTPLAVLPVRVEAEDDLGLVDVRLSATEPPGSAGVRSRSLPLDRPLMREARIDTQIEIAETGLTPGHRLMLRAEAADAYNLDGQHIARSVPRTLSIVSAEEKLSQLISRQSRISGALEQALERQSRLLQRTQQLQLQWQTASQLSMSDIESLRRMAIEQPRITDELQSDEQGGLPQVRRILDELQWNRIEDAAIVERLSHVQRELERLNADVAPPLTHAASLVARMAAAGTASNAGSFDTALSDLKSRQAEAGDVLSALGRLFSEWRRRHDLTRSVAEIASEQMQLNRETRETGRQTLATPLVDLAPGERAGLARIGHRQREIADRLDELEEQLRDAAIDPDDKANETSLPASDVRRALEILANTTLSAEAQRAAHLIENNSIAESVSAQQNITESLGRLKQAVQGLNSSVSETLLRRLERAEAVAQSFQQRQEELRNNTQQVSAAESSGSAQTLQSRQQGLTDETSEWAERLRRERLSDAASLAGDAAGRMASAAARLDDHDLEAAVDDQQAAAERLRRTRRQLARKRTELEFDQTLTEWSRASALLKAFAERQLQLLEESTRLALEQERKNGLSRSQTRSVLSLGQAQADLADDLEELGNRTDGPPVIREALAAPTDRMRTAAALLNKKQLDRAVGAAQQLALDQLELLLADLRREPSSDTGQASESVRGEGESPASGWPLATQFKVLARLQMDISRRAAAIRADHSAADAQSAEQQGELRRLADQQARLAAVLQELLDNEPDREADE